MFVSQPSTAMLPLQSANPGAHVPAQAPATQATLTTLFVEQMFPHAPQLSTSVPSVTQTLPQATCPCGQVVMQTPAVHD